MMEWKLKKKKVATVSLRSPALSHVISLHVRCSHQSAVCSGISADSEFWIAVGTGSEKGEEASGKGEDLGEDSLGQSSKLCCQVAVGWILIPS